MDHPELAWFRAFSSRHMARFPFFPWPESAEGLEVYLTGFHRLIIKNGLLDETIADEASIALMGEEIPWGSHITRFVAIGHDLYRARDAVEKAGTPDGIDAAKILSRDCPDCTGEGLAWRYRHQPVGEGTRENAAGFRFACYCTCPAGRWLAANHRDRSPEIYRRMIDLAEPRWAGLRLRKIGDGSTDSPHRYKPEWWDATSDRPILPTADYRADLAARGVVVPVREALAQPANRPTFAPEIPKPMPDGSGLSR